MRLISWAAEVGEPLDSTADARAAGVDLSDYGGWPVYCRAAPDDHPSTMATRTLRACLDRAGVAPAELDLVIYAGVSRDFLASWSVATEVVRGVGASCVGLDITLGCLGLLTGVDVALRRRGLETAVRVLIVGAIAWAIVDVIVTALGFGYTMWITSVSFVANLLPEPRGDFGCGALWTVIGGCLSAVMVLLFGGIAWALARGTHSRQRVGPSMRAG